MTTTSTSPTDAVVYVTSLVSSSASGDLYEQGSGVLIAPDEVLTAAHVVYDAAGHTFTDTEVSPGYAGKVVYDVVAAQTIHAMPVADWTQLSGTAGDFALIHLAAPITDVPVMALGSDFAGGPATVTGYPLAASGIQVSLAEMLSLVPGGGVLQGTPLGLPGDPHGASGGPVWEMVAGVPTVVGLTSSAQGAIGNFVDLTAADVAQVRAWEAADHPGAASLSAAPPPTSSHPASSAVADLSTDAESLPAIASHAQVDRAMTRLVSLLTQEAAASTAGFDAVAGDVLSRIGDNGTGRNLAAALLEGVVWGHDGGATSDAVAAVAASDPDILSYRITASAAHAGALAGQALHAAEA